MTYHITDQIHDRILFEPNTGHWLWLGPKNNHGYARISVHHHRHHGHRYIYEQLVGPIPTGMMLDHICRVRHCLAPSHLRIVTPRENSTRNSVSPWGLNAAKTHCQNGHLFDEANTARDKNGKRTCRACAATTQRERRAAAAQARQRSHCPAGHALTDNNVRVQRTTGQRFCQECKRASHRRAQAAYRARKLTVIRGMDAALRAEYGQSTNATLRGEYGAER